MCHKSKELTKLTISPSSKAVSKGTTIGFVVTATFNNSLDFEVSGLGMTDAHYKGWTAPVVVPGHRNTYFTIGAPARKLNTSNNNWEFIFNAVEITPTGNPESVNATFCGAQPGDVTKNNTAFDILTLLYIE